MTKSNGNFVQEDSSGLNSLDQSLILFLNLLDFAFNLFGFADVFGTLNEFPSRLVHFLNAGFVRRDLGLQSPQLADLIIQPISDERSRFVQVLEHVSGLVQPIGNLCQSSLNSLTLGKGSLQIGVEVSHGHFEGIVTLLQFHGSLFNLTSLLGRNLTVIQRIEKAIGGSLSIFNQLAIGNDLIVQGASSVKLIIDNVRFGSNRFADQFGNFGFGGSQPFLGPFDGIIVILEFGSDSAKTICQSVGSCQKFLVVFAGFSNLNGDLRLGLFQSGGTDL